jgi:hypothetical protein
MISREIEELASDIDAAATVVEELQDDHDADEVEKLDELHTTLEHAADTIDEIVDQDEKE